MVVRASSTVLGLLLLALVLRQLAELQGASELLPLTSFAVLLSLASLAMSWTRATPSTEQEACRVKRSGLDLLIAAVLNLVASALLQVSQEPLLKGTLLVQPLLLLHVLFIAVGLGLGWVALVALLAEAVAWREPIADR